MRLDVHAHLAGEGSGGSGCRLFPAFRRRPVVRLLRALAMRRMGDDPDAAFAARLAALVREAGLDGAVALGFDGVYDPASGALDEGRSQMIVPPSWVFEACRRHPELLPGPAVNPYRPDALERLDEAAERGAVLVKWLPATMAIDPADPRVLPFYRRMAERGLALLTHSGGSERTFAEVEPAFRSLGRIEPALDAGVTVVVAHSSVPVHLSRDPDELPLLRRLLVRHPRLWVDNSGIANPSRFAHLPRLADDPLIVSRTLYGSDYPVPSSAAWYVRRLGLRRAAALERDRNPVRRDVATKRALGYPDDTLTRASAVLPALAGRAPHLP
jgi:predicted TIM-barrel fold metal-dependent hydrolase